MTKPYKVNTMSEGGELLRTSEVAKILGVSIFTVRNWIKQGKIRAIRVGKSWYYIPRKEVERILKGGV